MLINAQRTMDDEGRQPIAIDHLSYSGNLKKKECAILQININYIPCWKN